VERRAGARTGPGRGARAPQAGRHKKKTAAGRGAAGAHKATSVSSSASAESGWFAGALSPSASSSDRNADPAIPAKHPTLTLPARTGIKNAIKTRTRRGTGVICNGVAPACQDRRDQKYLQSTSNGPFARSVSYLLARLPSRRTPPGPRPFF